jgi:transcriptional regulator with XRE-family HTH domain
MQEVDRQVATRVRQRRTMLGLSQQQLAELIGVTYQQAHKYEAGANRISAGRLYEIAQALGVGVGYFFQDVAQPAAAKPTDRQRAMLELARNFAHMPSRRHQEAIVELARALTSVPVVLEIKGAGSTPLDD